MPTLQEFSAIGTAGHLEGIAHAPNACPEPGRRDAPRTIAVVAHPLGQIRQIVLHEFSGQRI